MTQREAEKQAAEALIAQRKAALDAAQKRLARTRELASKNATSEAQAAAAQAATAVGLLISTFMRSQIAAIFGTAVLTILPAANFSGMIDPVSSLEGMGRLNGEVYPTTHFLTIARGTFSKALNFSDLHAAFLPLALAVPVLIGLFAALLKKQER